MYFSDLRRNDNVAKFIVWALNDSSRGTELCILVDLTQEVLSIMNVHSAEDFDLIETSDTHHENDNLEKFLPCKSRVTFVWMLEFYTRENDFGIAISIAHSFTGH